MIAVGTAVATTAFLIAIYSSLVMPTQTARLEIELLKKAGQIESHKRTIERSTRSLNDATTSLKKLQTHNSELSSTIATLHEAALYQASANLFTPGNPYPNGLGKARIGMNKDEVVTGNASLAFTPDLDSPDMLTFKIEDSPFERVTYYLDEKSKRVTHISFGMGFMHKYGDNYLHDKIVESFGASIESPRKGYFRWTVGGNKWHMLMTGGDTFVLLPYPELLAVWPQ